MVLGEVINLKTPYGIIDDYEKDWNPQIAGKLLFDFKGKTVFDLGADWGSTAEFFLKKGATKIISVDNNPYYLSQLRKNFEDDPKVIIISKTLGDVKEFETMLEDFRPQIVKMDIDGPEGFLLKLDNTALNIPEDYLIEIHEKDLVQQFETFFLRNGFKVLGIAGADPWIFYASRIRR